MRILMRLTLLASVLAVVSAAGFANPAPPFSETVADPTSYYQAVTDMGGNQYLWDITYNGAASLPDPEYMAAFAVYDATVTLVSTVDPSGWPGVPDGNHVAVEWYASPASTYRLSPPDSISFQATFNQPLANPFLTAIHIQYGENSEWVNNTPELPPAALLSLSMLPLGLAYIRGRRRNKED